MAKKIFISYDYDSDKHWKNLLVAWDKNSAFDFSFYDSSVDVSVDSTDAATIKRAISAKISSASYFLCIIGKDTHKSAWVKWEIEKAVEKGKRIIAVKTDSGNTSPSAILGVGATWAMSFTFDSIKSAVDSA
ncbi:MAG: TIR domain-containing protein [Colwellia sp.]|nr:TIR domain-containing protein [Colwellia sp.]